MKKYILKILTAITLISATIPTGYATDFFAIPTPIYAAMNSESNITPCADTIVIRYRMFQGKRQYRRWNETQNYWVDPNWIDVPQ